MEPVISVVLPVYNERESLEALLTRLVPVLEKAVGESFEAVFVDDGSDDGSAEILNAFHEQDERLKVIHFARNFGHQAAFQAGLDQASGQAVVLMDADLQHPPEMVEQFIERWRMGFDVVYGMAKTRSEGLLKRAAYIFFYRSLNFLAQIDVPLHAGDFCLLDRRVVDVLVALPERNRFLRGLRSWVGFKQLALEYRQEPRYAGVPKYTFRKLTQLALSGYIGFSTAPLHAAAWLGFLSTGAGFAMTGWALSTKILGIPSPRGWVSTIAVVLYVGGVQLLILGVIGEYLSRVYDEVRRRPLYIVRSRVGWDTDGAAVPQNRFARDGAVRQEVP
ncbi:MAG: glycosyltransferase family 2 protein [Candidatus Entotheonellia bacterium]